MALSGMYASTSRRATEIHRPDGRVTAKGDFVQVTHMANPLVNELIIGTGMKDRWNAEDPKGERRFRDFYLNPRLVAVINLAFGTDFPISGRTDLVAALLKYPRQNPNFCNRANRCSELLRLNTMAAPSLPAAQKRLGGLVGDVAGFPNGRRPNDDVTDIVLRVAAGALLDPPLDPPVPKLGDGVNFNIAAPGSNVTANGIYQTFPYLPTPHSGRDRRHIDCDEAGANPC